MEASARRGRIITRLRQDWLSTVGSEPPRSWPDEVDKAFKMALADDDHPYEAVLHLLVCVARWADVERERLDNAPDPSAYEPDEETPWWQR